jgi:signal transduction histidine kinase
LYEHPDSGTDYVIMLNSKMTPMRTVKRTLAMQFTWIAYLVLVAAMVVAYWISRLVSRPISRMNESAKRLAKGDYQVNFVGAGYRETRELAQTLNYAASELSKADGLQKELIANISHDLRSPLTMIKGYSEMIRDIPGENTSENMQVIIDEATRLSELVSDLLDISKLQAGMRPLEPVTFDLTQTVLETMDRYVKLTARDGYCIRFFSDCHAVIHADLSMILQVVYNLINNAINHCGEDKLVLVRQTVSEGTVRISVEDHGEGIEADQLPYIWDRYYKVDRVHRIATVGTGLGLSIVKNILEMHGARFGVESAVSQGSTFWFELPLAQREDMR